jgi:hypothetical protein
MSLSLQPALTMVSFSAYSTLKMEAMCSSETSVNFQQATWRFIPEDRTLHNHRSENLKSYKTHNDLYYFKYDRDSVNTSQMEVKQL